MLNRRKFLEGAAALGILGVLPTKLANAKSNIVNPTTVKNLPIIISTWPHGIDANKESMRILNSKGSIVDAVEKGVMIPEADPNNHSVGIGGFPDRDGKVTLDASIMGPDGNAGAVCFLEDIVHPISVARKVMDDTPHVMLSGIGALQFAIENGFKRENLLTPEMKKEWQKWAKDKDYDPKINWEKEPNKYHDTIGLLAIDENGEMAGACTTSGMGGKIRGRVGDSPIIGAGLFVDNEIGAATATGMGELVMKTLGSFLVVEFMRNGMSPQQACEKAVLRIVEKVKGYEKFQIGFIALNKKGETGAYSLQPGFNFALNYEDKSELFDAPSYFDELPNKR
jgi:isoaspartyl peptidase/L-asparaginase-like protein (Ntn-hydrolase superfamily)